MPSRRLVYHTAILLASAFVLAVASKAVSRTRLEVQGWDCPPLPASCAQPVLVLGFPLPYISDYHAISPVGSASLTNALLGVDLLHVGPFLANVGIYFLLGIVVTAAVRAVRTRHGKPSGTTAA
jgi:hypothetical protein